MANRIVGLFIFLFVFLFFAPFASAATLYLNPSSATIPQNSVASVSIKLDTEKEGVNAVAAYLNYPADKLEVAWITYGDSFSIAAEGSAKDGKIRISRGNVSEVTGDVTVATIGFKGKTQGKATVSFVEGSAVARASDSSDSLNLEESTGGIFTIGVPEEETDETKPVISDIIVGNLTTTSSTISWTTDVKTDSQIEYGLEENEYFLSSSDDTLTKEHTIKLESSFLTPGALFHFRVKSKDANGNEQVSGDKTFRLRGYEANIKILDTNQKPVVNAQVSIQGMSDEKQTSSVGEVSFANVTPGKHLVTIKISNNSEKTEEINVKDTPLSQDFTLTIDTKSAQTNYLYMGIGMLIILGVVVLIAIYFKKKQNSAINSLNQ